MINRREHGERSEMALAIPKRKTKIKKLGDLCGLGGKRKMYQLENGQ